MRASENMGIVFVEKPSDKAGAGFTGESISMAKYRHICYILQFGAITGNCVLTVKSGASDGVQTTSETFHYRLADAEQAAAAADSYGDWADSSSLTLTAATYDNKTLIIELDSDELTAGQPWLTIAGSAVGNPLNLSIVALLCEPRYGAHDMPTAI